MSAISKHIRERACGPTPVTSDGPVRVGSWVGHAKQWQVLDFLSSWECFFMAPDDRQRTFLLLVAEALK